MQSLADGNATTCPIPGPSRIASCFGGDDDDMRPPIDNESDDDDDDDDVDMRPPIDNENDDDDDVDMRSPTSNLTQSIDDPNLLESRTMTVIFFTLQWFLRMHRMPPYEVLSILRHNNRQGHPNLISKDIKNKRKLK